MLKYLLFAQCAILLTSFEGIVCPKMDFVIQNFGIADIYNVVKAEGDAMTGMFIFDKDDTANNYRRHIVPYVNILRDTVVQEPNSPCIVSFFAIGQNNANFNINFKFEWQARYYVENGTLPEVYEILWARIYSNWQPAIMAYFHLNDNDMGFKILDNGNHPDPNARLSELPFIFKRSEIDNALKIVFPLSLYLRNTRRSEDYIIIFSNPDNLAQFQKLFPKAKYNEPATSEYYYIPG